MSTNDKKGDPPQREINDSALRVLANLRARKGRKPKFRQSYSPPPKKP